MPTSTHAVGTTVFMIRCGETVNAQRADRGVRPYKALCVFAENACNFVIAYRAGGTCPTPTLRRNTILRKKQALLRLLFHSFLRFSRNLLKNALSIAEHSSSSTPGTTSGFWLHGSMNRSTAEPQQPLVGSFAP